MNELHFKRGNLMLLKEFYERFGEIKNFDDLYQEIQEKNFIDLYSFDEFLNKINNYPQQIFFDYLFRTYNNLMKNIEFLESNGINDLLEIHIIREKLNELMLNVSDINLD